MGFVTGAVTSIDLNADVAGNINLSYTPHNPSASLSNHYVIKGYVNNVQVSSETTLGLTFSPSTAGLTNGSTVIYEVQAFGTNNLPIGSLMSTNVMYINSFSTLSIDKIMEISTSQISSLSTSQIQALPTNKLQALTSMQIQALSNTQIQALSTTQIKDLRITQIKALKTSQLQAMSTTQIGDLTQVQAKSLSASQLKSFNTAQLNNLTVTPVQAKTPAQIPTISSTDMLGILADDFLLMDSDQINAFTPTQAAVIDTTIFQSMIQLAPSNLDNLSLVKLQLKSVSTLSQLTSVNPLAENILAASKKVYIPIDLGSSVTSEATAILFSSSVRNPEYNIDSVTSVTGKISFNNNGLSNQTILVSRISTQPLSIINNRQRHANVYFKVADSDGNSKVSQSNLVTITLNIETASSPTLHLYKFNTGQFENTPSGIGNRNFDGTYTFILSSNSEYVVTDPNTLADAPICFPAGTLIQTDQGQIPIEKIDCLTNTIRSKKIVGITKTKSIYDYNILITKNSLGPNIPSQNTVISPDHKIFYNRAMLCSKYLVNKVQGVFGIEYDGSILYNVLLETHDKMIVNNLICETLNPNNIIAKIFMSNLTGKKYNQAIKMLNKYTQTKNAQDYYALGKYLLANC